MKMEYLFLSKNFNYLHITSMSSAIFQHLYDKRSSFAAIHLFDSKRRKKLNLEICKKQELKWLTIS